MDVAVIRILAGAGAFLAVAAGAAVVALHVGGSGVDPRTDGVSAYALGPLGWLYRLQVIATGVAALLLTVALVGGGSASGPAIGALVLFGASRILIARYPTDPRGTTSLSRAGRLHVMLAAVTFLSIAVAAPAISSSLVADPAWAGPAGLLTMLGWAATCFALGTFASATTPATRRVFGLVERGAYTATLGWLAVASVAVAAVT